MQLGRSQSGKREDRFPVQPGYVGGPPFPEINITVGSTSTSIDRLLAVGVSVSNRFDSSEPLLTQQGLMHRRNQHRRDCANRPARNIPQDRLSNDDRRSPIDKARVIDALFGSYRVDCVIYKLCPEWVCRLGEDDQSVDARPYGFNHNPDRNRRGIK